VQQSLKYRIRTFYTSDSNGSEKKLCVKHSFENITARESDGSSLLISGIVTKFLLCAVATDSIVFVGVFFPVRTVTRKPLHLLDQIS